MKTRNLLTLLGSAAGMLLLILDSKTALQGVREGITLCLNVLLPALFPFCVLSVLITGSIIGKRILLLTPVRKICRIPSGCESLFAVGILGGYPVGAQNVMATFRDKKLTGTDAQRLAVFCNNAGPSFIFGMLGPLFPNRRDLWALWCIQILSAIIIGMFIPGECQKSKSLDHGNAPSVPEAITTAAKSMVSICSCVILFRMLLAFLSQRLLCYFPQTAQVIVSGFLELSNGCLMLDTVENPNLRFILASVFLSFGGICVWMQTVSVCSGLSMKGYLLWKSVQSAIAALLAIAIVTLSVRSMVLLIPVIVLPALLTFRKKEVAF